ncbi:hypothetical protein HPP92_017453 [Vanilla planifolia]|uniref:Uncharacterized protein n=1 Tax=Vanilla planifolia TaxID=51239 RepID=A0A835Q806_VANPL|nr:hypothetical protein HPP92_017453 [Vanilla planifolia]
MNEATRLGVSSRNAEFDEVQVVDGVGSMETARLEGVKNGQRVGEWPMEAEAREAVDELFRTWFTGLMVEMGIIGGGRKGTIKKPTARIKLGTEMAREAIHFIFHGREETVTRGVVVVHFMS